MKLPLIPLFEEKLYQNVIDQLQFLTKEHNYQINRKDGLNWCKDAPFYVYTLTKNMLKYDD